MEEAIQTPMPVSPGQFLAFWRRQRGLTQDQVCALVRCHRQTIHNIERDKVTPSAQTWAELVDLLEIPNAQALSIWLKKSC